MTMSDSLPPQTQAPPPSPEAELNHCVNNIIAEIKHPNLSSARSQANLHFAMVGLSMIIAREQQGAHGRLSEMDSWTTFPISQAPAMRELITNPLLFRVILSMLSSNALVSASGHQTEQGRKRSPSEDLAAHARKKQMLATPPPNRQRQTSHSQLPGISTNVVSTSLPESVCNHQVFAATVLYSVLQHMDHWPIELMKVFAEDAFGQRTWVDNEQCQDLVSNLQMSLCPDASDEAIDAASSVIADEAESYFSSLLSGSERNESSPKSLPPSRVVISSQKRTPSAKEVPTQSMQTEAMDDSASSSSGEEELLESAVREVGPITHPYHDVHSSGILNKLFRRSPSSNRRIRSRYLGHNLDLAYEAISDALTDRLSSKAKQNSRLLQALPGFLCIPRIRCLSSRHLEKWLQSPALAGLARHLLAQIARNLANEDPPLPDDVEVIDNVLKMKLKANQFSMHVENIALIATRLPTKAVAKQIFLYCLAGETTNGGDVVMDPSPDHLEILRSVYTIFDSDLAAQSLASAMLALASHSTQYLSRSMRLVVNALGDRYDGFTFTQSIIKSKTGVSINMLNESAQLIFQCAMLVGLGNGLEDKLASKMLTLRKAVLQWCVTELGRTYYDKILKEERSRCNSSYDGTGVVVTGPGRAVFDSYLDGSSRDEIGQDDTIPEFIKKVRCLLFLNSASSNELAEFSGHEFDAEESECINFCCRYSYAVDDELLNIVLESPNITPSTAIAIIENLILGCSSAQENISISSGIIWKVYELSEYVPQLHSNVCKEDLKLPRLAHPCLWWRVTAIALVVCSLSSHVGITMWNEHPTLRALIKMTTSQKYRFPTADCDDVQKEVVRLEEAKVREKEAKIAELLFAPPSPKPSKTDDPKPAPHRPPDFRHGLRTSARQQEKKDRIFALEQERKAAAIHAEQMKLRRHLKVLQKSIMIWEPVQCPRKPPKESVDMLLSINETFNMAEKFRSSIEPDFLLQTIGDGRSAIERAYDWLIPIISLHPEIIHRLQPSATCFLLLRAYGAEAGKSKELIGLSSPLLSHVRKCLGGEFGERHSLLALELLLTDIADENADRRRCSRKVLQQAIPNNFGLCGWMRQLKFATNAKSVVPLTIAYVCRALAYERGKVLSVFILYLHEYKQFLIEHELEDSKFNYIGSLCALISTRPHVVSDAMEGDARLQKLVLSEITKVFDDAMVSSKDSNNNDIEMRPSLVSITLSSTDHGSTTKNIVVSSCLIRAAIVVISNWQDTGKNESNTNMIGEEIGPEESFHRLLRYLVFHSSSSAGEEIGTKPISGLASAVYKHSNLRASSVEDWVSLAKAKAGIVAKHAALSAPDVFLPRLLLCCGISPLSFSTMLRRLNEMGGEEQKKFGELLSPTAISAWGLPRIGNRRILKRKLLGRILAYMRISRYNRSSNDDEKSSDIRHMPFVSWLLGECKPSDRSKKGHARSSSCRGSVTYFATEDLITETEFAPLDADDLDAPAWSTCDSLEVATGTALARTEVITEDFVRSCVVNEKYTVLEESLDLKEKAMIMNSQYDDNSTAKVLLGMYSTCQDDDCFVRILQKWVPRMLQVGRGNDIWQIIFVDLLDKTKFSLKFETCVALVSSCAMIWPHEHILECQRWVVSQQAKCCPLENYLSLKLVLRFLVLSSEQISIHTFDQYRTQSWHFHYVQSPECAKGIVDLCLACLVLETQECTERQACIFDTRNVLPDWLVLILFVAKVGKEYLDLTTDLILNRTDESPSVYSALLLRLYTLHPSLANLSKTRLRRSLLQGAREHMASWLKMRCPLDSQIKAMISYLSKSPHKPLLQSIIQIANQHPLLLMRHLNVIRQGLIDDGSGLDSHGQPLIKRGRVQGKIPEAIAEINGRMIKVTIIQWGYSFSEPVWSSMLDLLLSVPAEVLFKVGAGSGLNEIMDVYSRLFVVHANDLKSETSVIQLRAKFNRLSSSFKTCDPQK